MRTLYNYQKDVVKYIQENKSAPVFLRMRLGKSLCTIRALQDIPGRKLIVCPKSVIPTWCDELEKEEIQDYLWFSSELLKRAQKLRSPALEFALPGWVVVNYEAVTRFPKSLMKMFGHVVIDESVNIKNPKAKLTKFFLQEFKDADRKILLSGNPAPNSPLEYFTQMKFLYGNWLGCDNYWQFRKRYFTSDQMGWQWWARNSSKEIIKKDLQKRCFFLSRADVGVDSKKVYEKRYVEMDGVVKKKYKQMEKEFATTLPDGKELETNYVLSQLLFLQELASGHILDQEVSKFKINELVNLLKGELKDEQVLVWCRFRWEIDTIVKAIQCAQITGDTPLAQRKALQDNFNKKLFPVLVLQIATSRYGLNLAAADTAIYFSNTFSLDDRDQSEARIQLNEKKQPLLYIDLITRDTVEEQILKALQAKRKSANFYMAVAQAIKEKYQ